MLHPLSLSKSVFCLLYLGQKFRKTSVRVLLRQQQKRMKYVCLAGHAPEKQTQRPGVCLKGARFGRISSNKIGDFVWRRVDEGTAFELSPAPLGMTCLVLLGLLLLELPFFLEQKRGEDGKEDRNGT